MISMATVGAGSVRHNQSSPNSDHQDPLNLPVGLYTTASWSQSTAAVIDLGASSSFVATTFVAQYRILLLVKGNPVLVKVIESSVQRRENVNGNHGAYGVFKRNFWGKTVLLGFQSSEVINLVLRFCLFVHP